MADETPLAPSRMSRNGRNPKSPAFQLYPTDFISDPKVQAMTTEEVGVYFLLLCQAWLDGGIPNDVQTLARRTRLPLARFSKAWTVVKECWSESENGRLTNPRMEREREFQIKNRERMQKLSHKGVAARQNDSPGDRTVTEVGSSHGDLPIPDAQRPTPDTRIPTPDVEEEPANKPPESRVKKPRKPASGQNADCIRFWESEWTRTRLGTKCAITAADGVAVAWMLNQADAQEVQRRMTLMLEDGEAWIAKNASPSLLRSKWNAYAVTLTTQVAAAGTNVADLWRSQKDRA